MTTQYDQYYKTENLFGEPSKELLNFFRSKDPNSTVIDIGCGQGRDAIAVGRLGFKVIGVDNSKTGIEQLNVVAKNEGLNVTGMVGNMFNLDGLNEFDFFILDSMFHFTTKDREKEVKFLKSLLSESKPGAEFVICNQNTGDKCKTIVETFLEEKNAKLKLEQEFEYIFTDSETNHQSTTPYKLLVFEKLRLT